MRLLIDGDACPDRKQVIDLACHYHIETILFIDYAHEIRDDRISIVYCEVGKDSVDTNILKYVTDQDVVITQDYGLASLCLMKDAMVLHVSGKRITEHNINRYLEFRYIGHMSRKSQNHIKGPKKRSKSDSQYFLRELEKIFIEERMKERDISIHCQKEEK